MKKYIVASTVGRYAGNAKYYKFLDLTEAVKFANKKQGKNKKAVCVYEVISEQIGKAYGGGNYTQYNATRIYNAKTQEKENILHYQLTEFD